MFEVFTAAIVQVFWVVTPSSLLGGVQLFNQEQEVFTAPIGADLVVCSLSLPRFCVAHLLAVCLCNLTSYSE
jgi:hypothetical protein